MKVGLPDKLTRDTLQEIYVSPEALEHIKKGWGTNKWDKRFLEMAKLVSSWSKDPSTQVGAVLVKDKRIISVGFNGLAQGVPDHKETYENRELKYAQIIHGEINAILFAERTILKGATLYTYPFMPCSNCSSIIIQTGICKVVSLENKTERWQKSFDMTRRNFREACIDLVLYKEDILNG